MKKSAKTRLAKIMPNLPEPCRNELFRLQERGWECGFFLGVRDETMVFCLAAEKERQQHIVFDESIAGLVARLMTRIPPERPGSSE